MPTLRSDGKHSFDPEPANRVRRDEDLINPAVSKSSPKPESSPILTAQVPPYRIQARDCRDMGAGGVILERHRCLNGQPPRGPDIFGLGMRHWGAQDPPRNPNQPRSFKAWVRRRNRSALK